MPQKIKNLTMVNADINIKEQIECSKDMRHFISESVFRILLDTGAFAQGSSCASMGYLVLTLHVQLYRLQTAPRLRT
jgi:hypothetical protein